jgi:hypothetical protein
VAGVESASAHRLDEYLQAMRVDIRHEGILLELDLTPGAALAPAILAALDPDGDERIEPAVSDAYAGEVMRSLRLTIDGQQSVLALASREFPSATELRAGVGVVRLVFVAELSQTTGLHRMVVENGYRNDVSVYLANALRTESRAVTIASQLRDPGQRSLTIDYVVGRQLLARVSGAWTGAAALLIGFTAYWRRRQSRSKAAEVRSSSY